MNRNRLAPAIVILLLALQLCRAGAQHATLVRMGFGQAEWRCRAQVKGNRPRVAKVLDGHTVQITNGNAVVTFRIEIDPSVIENKPKGVSYWLDIQSLRMNAAGGEEADVFGRYKCRLVRRADGMRVGTVTFRAESKNPDLPILRLVAQNFTQMVLSGGQRKPARVQPKLKVGSVAKGRPG